MAPLPTAREPPRKHPVPVHAAPAHDRSQQDQNREPFAETRCPPHVDLLGPAFGAADFHTPGTQGMRRIIFTGQQRVVWRLVNTNVTLRRASYPAGSVLPGATLTSRSSPRVGRHPLPQRHHQLHPPCRALLRGLDRVLDHVHQEWSTQPRPRDPVFARYGWRCAVPACTSRRTLHDHHLPFRSRAGGNARENRITVCAWHHLRGIHEGRVRPGVPRPTPSPGSSAHAPDSPRC